MTSALQLFGSTGLPTKKTYQKIHFQTFAQKMSGWIFFGWIHPALLRGEIGFWVTLPPKHPSPSFQRPGEDASILSWQLSWRPRLQRLPSCDTIANVLRSEASRWFRGWVGIWGQRFFWASKRIYPARVPVTNEGFIKIPWSRKNVTCRPGGNDCGLKGEVSSCNLLVPL